MIYSEKNYDEIFGVMLQDAFRQKLISHDEMFLDYIANKEDISNFYVMILAIHSDAIAEVYREMTNVYNSSKVEFAEGTDLDDIGLIINCSRPEALPAGVTLTFSYTGIIEESVNIPSGVVVSNGKGISYRTVEDFTFTDELDEVEVMAVATVKGTGSRVAENQLTKLVTPLEHVKVTNPAASVGGSDKYTDEQYRELLLNWVKSKQRGNEWAYRDYFSRLDGVGDYKIIPNWDGAGTIKCIVTPSNSYFLNKVYNELQSDVTQATEDIVVVAPVNRPVDIYIYCNVDIDRINPYSSNEKDTIKSKVEAAVREYISSMGIGEDLIPFKLGAYLDKQIVELKNIEFNYPTKPVTITDEEKCSLGELEIIME